jgi:hypothetical protein
MRRSRLLVPAATLLVAVPLVGCDRAGDEEPAPQPIEEDAADEAEDADDEPSSPEPDEDDEAAAESEADAEDEPEPPPDQVERFEDPEELAATLATAERALADPDTPSEHVAGWAAVHQQAHRDLAANPEWRDTARDEVPEELRDAFDLTLRAVTELFELTEPREDLPDWRIEPPPPTDELRDHYEAAEAEFGVPWHVLAAIHLVETRFGRIHGDSHAGAQGPMQFMPGTWDAYGEGDVNDPRDAIMAAGHYLAASGAPDDLPGAVHAYNRSDYYVEAVLAHAEAMERHEHYLDVYHGWRVYYRTVDGDVVLEEGYGA